MTGVQVVVLAKEPVPGRVKTRLSPPCRPDQAAGLARAALTDTLVAVLGTSAVRRVLALDGALGPWLPPGFAVQAQRGDGLDERLASAFDDAYAACPAPIILLGMDTPQVTPELLSAAAGALRHADAVFGPAVDGGFWLLGLRRPDAGLLRGVPMSTGRTGAAQHARLVGAGLRVARTAELRDVDTAADAAEVADLAPGTRFARQWAGLAPAGAAPSGAAPAESVEPGPVA